MALSAEEKLLIHELFTNIYLRIDAEDAAGFASYFTDDGVFGAPYGDYKGRPEVQRFMQEHVDKGMERGVRHFLTNFVIDGNGNSGVAKFYILKLNVAGSPSFNATADCTAKVSKGANGWAVTDFRLGVDHLRK